MALLTSEARSGHRADRIAGALSRLLHGLRGPKINTLWDLERYFDLSPEALFPAPPPLVDVTVHDAWTERFLKTTTLSWRSSHEVISPSYRVKHEREYAANLTAWARWLRPDRTRRQRCLVYVHGWLEPGSWIEEGFIFPGWVRHIDTDVVHVSLPFHGRRNPKGALFSGEYFWTADLVRSVEAVRQAIHDTRSITGWLRRQGYEQVGIAGISVGGSLTMMLACLDPVPDYIVAIVAHLRLYEAVEHASILWRVKKDLERWGVGLVERREMFRRLGLDAFRPKLPPDRQLWIAAREDAHIDPALVEEQWRAWNKPVLHWLPGGHMTFPLHLPQIARKMAEFVQAVPLGSDAS